MNTTTTTAKQVDLVVHTTCGIEFEVIDVATNKSLTDGRVYWCSDEDIEEDEEIESRGWNHFRKRIAKQGWAIRQEVWS